MLPPTRVSPNGVEKQNAHAYTGDVMFKGMPVTFTWLPLSELSAVEKSSILGVVVVPFTADDGIVMVELQRGLEIPGGKIEPTDFDLETTARREAWEEARIVLGQPELTLLVRVDWRDREAPPGYIVVFAANVRSMAPFEQNHESMGRMVVSSADYIDMFGFGPVEMRERMVWEARKALSRSETVRIPRWRPLVRRAAAHSGSFN
jgi:8-oxo-dGTP diphosphatase